MIRLARNPLNRALPLVASFVCDLMEQTTDGMSDKATRSPTAQLTPSKTDTTGSSNCTGSNHSIGTKVNKVIKTQSIEIDDKLERTPSIGKDDNKVEKILSIKIDTNKLERASSIGKEENKVNKTAQGSTDENKVTKTPSIGKEEDKVNKTAQGCTDENKVTKTPSTGKEVKVEEFTLVEDKLNKTDGALAPETEVSNKTDCVPSAGVETNLELADKTAADASPSNSAMANNVEKVPSTGTDKTELDTGSTKGTVLTKVRPVGSDSAKIDKKGCTTADKKATHKAKAGKKHQPESNLSDPKFRQRVDQIMLRVMSISEQLKQATATALNQLGAAPPQPNDPFKAESGKESSNDCATDDFKMANNATESPTKTEQDSSSSDPPSAAMATAVCHLSNRSQKLNCCLKELADTLEKEFCPSLKSRLEQEYCFSTHDSTVGFLAYLQSEMDSLKRQSYQIEDLVYSNSVQHHLILDQILTIIRNSQRISEDERFSQIKQLVLVTRHKYPTLKIFRTLTKLVNNGTFAGAATLKKIKKQVVQYKVATTQSQAVINQSEFQYSLIEKIEPVLTEMATFLLQLKLLRWTFEMKIGGFKEKDA